MRGFYMLDRKEVGAGGGAQLFFWWVCATRVSKSRV